MIFIMHQTYQLEHVSAARVITLTGDTIAGMILELCIDPRVAHLIQTMRRETMDNEHSISMVAKCA